MENRDLEIEMYLERIRVLEKENNEYKRRYGSLDSASNSFNKEEKIEQVKEVAKKGLDISKDIFSVTKSVFGKAKDTFHEEWDKQKNNKPDATTYDEQKTNVVNDDIEDSKK